MAIGVCELVLTVARGRKSHMCSRQSSRLAKAAALAAILVATFGVHAAHPWLHRGGDEHPATREYRAATPHGSPASRSSVEHSAEGDCLVCAFLTSFHSCAGYAGPFIGGQDSATHLCPLSESLLPQQSDGLVMGPRAPPAACPPSSAA